jgi:type IV pilus assembly protein PilE
MRQRKNNNRERRVESKAGFTLIEMLIVLAVMMVLAAIVYPSYAGYVVKARRIEGKSALMEAVQQEERYYTRSNTYIAFSAESTDAQERRFKWWSGSAAATSAYELSARACPGRELSQCVEVRATPGTAKVDPSFRDADCQELTLNSAGERTAAGPSARCWP